MGRFVLLRSMMLLIVIETLISTQALSADTDKVDLTGKTISQTEADVPEVCQKCLKELITRSGSFQREYSKILPSENDLPLKSEPANEAIGAVIDNSPEKNQFLPFDRIVIPTHIENGDLPLIHAAFLSTIVLLPEKKNIVDLVSKFDGKVATKASKFGSEFGTNLGLAAAAGSMIYAVVLNDKNVADVVPIQLKTMITVGVLNNVLKEIFHRALPEDSKGAWDRGRKSGSANLSFPSGHTTGAIVFADIISENTKGKSTIIPILAYVAAGITALSRIHDRQHYAADVIASIYSHYVAKAMLAKDSGSTRNFVIEPALINNGFGAQIRWMNREEDRPCVSKKTGLEGKAECLGYNLNKKGRL